MKIDTLITNSFESSTKIRDNLKGTSKPSMFSPQHCHSYYHKNFNQSLQLHRDDRSVLIRSFFGTTSLGKAREHYPDLFNRLISKCYTCLDSV